MPLISRLKPSRSSFCLAILAAAIVMLSSCGRQPESQDAASRQELTPTAETQLPAPNPADTTPAESTNAFSLAQTVARKLQASPFASANPALKLSFTRALMAQANSNPAAAYSELDALSKAGGLTPQQIQAVQTFLAELATNAPAATAQAQESVPGPVFPLTQEGSSVFSTAYPAVAESFAAAELAFKIQDYDRALNELRSLETNAQLNWQQKYAVQQLLSKVPQTVPGIP